MSNSLNNTNLENNDANLEIADLLEGIEDTVRCLKEAYIANRPRRIYMSQGHLQDLLQKYNDSVK
jgi:hypothetical protein